MTVVDVSNTQVFEEPLFSQLRHDLSLYDYIHYEQNISSVFEKQQQYTARLRSAIILAAVEFTDELKDTVWIESLTDMTQLPVDQVKQRIVHNLEIKYQNRQYISTKGFYQPTINEIKKYLSTNRQNQNSKFVLHYVGRHALLQLEDAIVLSQDEQQNSPLAMPITEISKLFNEQTVYIFDCNYAGLLVQTMQQNQKYDSIAFGACQSNQKLPYMQQRQLRSVPTDIFSLSMMSPLLGLLIAYIHRNNYQKQYQTFEQLYKLYQTKIEENSSLYQELNHQILKQITETIVWQSTNQQQYYQLCKQDKQLANIINNYFVCQRVMSAFNCQCCTTLNLPDQSNNYLWSQFDMFLNQAVFGDSDIGYYQRVIQRQNLMGDGILNYSQENTALGSMKSIYSVYSLNDLEADSKTCLKTASLNKQTSEPIFNFAHNQIRSFQLQLNNPYLRTPQNLPIIIHQISNPQNAITCINLLYQLIDRDPSQCKTIGEIGLVIQVYKHLYQHKMEYQKITSVNNLDVVHELCVIFSLLNKMYCYDLSNLHYYKIIKNADMVSDKEFLSKIIIYILLYNRENESSIKSICLLHLNLITCGSSQKMFCNRNQVLKENINFIQTIINYLIKHTSVIQILFNIVKLSNDHLLRMNAFYMLGNLLPHYFINQISQCGAPTAMTPNTRRQIRYGSDMAININVQLLKQYNDEDGFKQIMGQINMLIQLFYEQHAEYCVEVRLSAICCIQSLIPNVFECTQLYRYNDHAAVKEQKTDQGRQQSLAMITSLLRDLQSDTAVSNGHDGQDNQYVAQEDMVVYAFSDVAIEQLRVIYSHEVNSQVRYNIFVAIVRLVMLCYQSIVEVCKEQMYKYFKQVLPQEVFISVLPKCYQGRYKHDRSVLFAFLQDCTHDSDGIISHNATKLLDNIQTEAFILLVLKFKVNKDIMLKFQENLKEYMNSDEVQIYQMKQQQYFEEHEVSKLVAIYQNLGYKLTEKDEKRVYSILCHKKDEDGDIVNMSYNDYSGLKALSMSPKQNNHLLQQQETSDHPQQKENIVAAALQEDAGVNCQSDTGIFDAISPPEGDETVEDEYAVVTSVELTSALPTLDAQLEDDINRQEECHTSPPKYDFPSKFQQMRFDFIINKIKTMQEFERELELLQAHIYYIRSLVLVGNLRSSGMNMLFNALLHQNLGYNIGQLAQQQASRLHRQISGCYLHSTLRINDAGCSCGNHIGGIYCTSCGAPTQQTKELAKQHIKIKSYSSYLSFSNDKRSDFLKNHQFADVDNNICDTFSFCNLVEKVTGNGRQWKGAGSCAKTAHKAYNSADESSQQGYVIRYGIRPSNSNNCQCNQFGAFLQENNHVIDEIDKLNTAIDQKIKHMFIQSDAHMDCFQQMVYAYPLQNSQELIKNNIVVSISSDLSEAALKTKNQFRSNYQQSNAVQVYQQQRSVEQFTENFLNDGDIYRAYQQTYDSQFTQQLFQQIHKHFSLHNSQKPDDNDTQFVGLDQSCQFCKNIAVRRSILEVCTQKNNQPIYQPTKEFEAIVLKDLLSCGSITLKSIFKKNDVPDSQLTQCSIQQYNNKLRQLMFGLSSPFPLLDYRMQCCDHMCRYLSRSIYRICYQNSDLLLQYGQRPQDTSENKELLLQLEKLQEKQNRTVEQANQSQLFQQLQAQICSEEPLQNNVGCVSYKEQLTAITDKQREMYLSEQTVYLQQLRKKINTIHEYNDGDLCLVDQFQTSNDITFMKMHPLQPIIAIFTKNNQISLYNIEKRCNINNITSGTLFQNQCRSCSLRHNHGFLESDQIRKFSEVFNKMAVHTIKKYNQYSIQKEENSVRNQYYAEIIDRQNYAYGCQLCQNINMINGFTVGVNQLPDLDLYDKNCNAMLENTQKYMSDQAEYSKFFDMDMQLKQFDSTYNQKLVNTRRTGHVGGEMQQNQILSDNICVTNMQFLNVRNSYPLLGVSYQYDVHSSCYYEVFNNIYEPGCSRAVSSFKVFDITQKYQGQLNFVNPLIGIQVLDAYRRICSFNLQQCNNQNYEWLMRNELQQCFIENKVRNIVRDLGGFRFQYVDCHDYILQNRPQFISSLDQNQLQLQSKVLFTRGQELKVVDLAAERAVFCRTPVQTEQFGLSNISAACLNKGLMALADVDGSVQIIDLKSGQRVNTFKFGEQVERVFPESHEVINCYVKSGSLVRKFNQNIDLVNIHNHGAQGAIKGFVKQNVGGFSQNAKGLVDIYDLSVSQQQRNAAARKKSIKIEKFDDIEFRADGLMFAVRSANNIRIYGGK